MEILTSICAGTVYEQMEALIQSRTVELPLLRKPWNAIRVRKRSV